MRPPSNNKKTNLPLVTKSTPSVKGFIAGVASTQAQAQAGAYTHGRRTDLPLRRNAMRRGGTLRGELVGEVKVLGHLDEPGAMQHEGCSVARTGEKKLRIWHKKGFFKDLGGWNPYATMQRGGVRELLHTDPLAPEGKL